MRKWLFFMLTGYLWKKFGTRSATVPGRSAVGRRESLHE